MTGVPSWLRKGHGTEARCRRHYREGGKPCLECKEAANQARSIRKNGKSRRGS